MNNLQLKVILAAADKLTAPLRAGQRTAKGLAGAMAETKKRIADMEKQAKQIDGYKKLAAQTGIVGNKLKEAQAEVKRLHQEMSAADAPTKQQAKALKEAKEQAAALTRQYAEMTERQQRQRTALNEAGLSTRSLSTHQRTLRTDVAAANQQLEQQRERLARVVDQERRLANARESANRARAMRGRLVGAGAAAAATGGAALYAGSRVLAPGVDFGAEMSRVQALTRLQKNDPQMRALHDQARDLGAKTSFTAGQAAQGQGFLAMAGFTPQAIRDAMPGMLDLARAAGAELGATADIGSNILTGFNLPASQMSRVGDVLVGTFTRSNTDLSMLGETMKYVAPVAAGMGVSIEQAAAMAGKLGDAGIQGSMAGTALRAILGRLAAPPKMAADALEELGIKTADAKGNLRDMPAILADLELKTRRMGNTARAGYFKAIAGEEAFAALEVLTKQAGNGGLRKLLQEIRAANGEAELVAATMADNIKGDLDEMQSAWEDFGIQLTETSDGPIRTLIKQATGLIRTVSDWTKANPELTATLTKVAAGTAALAFVGGTAAMTIAGLLGPLIALRLAASLLGIRALPMLGAALLWAGKAFLVLGRALLLNPIGLTITAVVALAYVIYKYWAPLKRFFANLWASFTNSVSSAWRDTTAWFDTLPGRAMKAGSRMMRNFTQGIRDQLPNIDGVMDQLRAIVPDWVMGDEPALAAAGAPLRTDYAPLMARAGNKTNTTHISAPITIVQQPGENSRDLANRLQGELQQVVAGKPARPWAVLGDLE